MFGRYEPEISTHETPDWILDLVKKHCNKKVDIRWWPSKTRYGCYWISDNIIELHCPKEKTDAGVMLVLHEIGHALVRKKGCLPYRKAGKPSYHSIEFWETVGNLYSLEGVYDFASKNDSYALGRRYLKEHKGRIDIRSFAEKC